MVRGVVESSSGGGVMGRVHWKRSLIVFCVFLFLLLLCVDAFCGVPALILTNTGKTAEGSLRGLSAVIRLSVPQTVTYTGPAQAFDIPLTTIRQITLDFPRVIIETPARVYIGPFSAFSGISEILTLKQEGGEEGFPTASLRAIALHGEPLRPVPREWLGSGFLSTPVVIAVSPVAVDGARRMAEEESEATPAQTWNDLYPTVPPQTEEETPWWVGMLIVAGLVALIYMSVGGQ
jgi:hypothetical protein